MSLLKSLTLLTLVAVPDADRFKCDYTFYKDAGGYLKFQEMPLTFDDAKQSCASEGSILASPINDGVNLAMIGIVNNMKVKPEQVFTGISKKSSQFFFSSVEGIRLSNIQHTWAPGEPNNMDNKERCIAMLADGTLADVKCYKPLPHFCLLTESKAKKLNDGLENKGYTMDNSTGSYYKFHQNKLEYDDAAKACEGEGGHLLIINGDTEAEAVRNLFIKAVNRSLEYCYAFIGFRLNKDTGEWMTLQGETIEEAGYAKWGIGEPNKIGNIPFCGAVDFNGNLDDTECNSKHAFICEIKPEIVMCK